MRPNLLLHPGTHRPSADEHDLGTDAGPAQRGHRVDEDGLPLCGHDPPYAQDAQGTPVHHLLGRRFDLRDIDTAVDDNELVPVGLVDQSHEL